MKKSNRRNTLRAALCCMPLFAATALATQTVNFANVTRNGATVTGPLFVAAGDAVKFDAVLAANGAANPPGTSGLGLCLEYPVPTSGHPTIANVLSAGFVGTGTPTALAGCNAGQSPVVPGADTVVVVGWAAISGTWPNVAIPIKLYDARFTLTATPAGSTRIGFGASSVAQGETFSSNGPLVLCGKPTATVAQIANGSEPGTAAAFSVSLSAAIPAECGVNGAFVVTLSLGGTATPPGQTNSDYSITGTGISNQGTAVTASFPSDGATKTLTVVATPVADAQVEPGETVTLTIAGGTGNYGGVGGLASATIADAVPAAVVVEYLDTIDFPGSPGGHFFYSSDPAEQAAVDAGAAGNFHRTGREFRTGGTSPVCRFYGSVTPGPNSHFFTVEVAECNALKAAQIRPTPTNVQQWNYERDEYLTTPPIVAGDGTRSCPAGTQPLYRAYNNAFPPSGPRNPWDSNHRFTPLQTDIEALVALGWRNEGIAFCTPQ